MAIDLTNSALVVVDMQNDFVHPNGVIGRFAKANACPLTVPRTATCPRDGNTLLAFSGSRRIVHLPIVDSVASNRIAATCVCELMSFLYQWPEQRSRWGLVHPRSCAAAGRCADRPP